jgi:hypothetical protein
MHLFKSLAACLGEMVSTIFRLIISSAISRLVHWLIGRPDFSGGSHANASSWQRWSAVIRAGAPGRGRSSSRSSALNSSSGIGSNASHLARHRITVSRLTPTSRLIDPLSWPTAASRIILARLAICWRVLWPLSNFSNARRISSDNVIGVAFGPGIFLSLSLPLDFDACQYT